MSLLFALLTALTATGAALLVLHPLRRAARRSGDAAGEPPNQALLAEIEREVRAVRTRGRTRPGRPGGGV